MDIKKMSSLEIMENREELEEQMYDNLFGQTRKTEILAEDIILELAGMIQENRSLKWEVARLRVLEAECDARREERCRESERATRTMFEALFVGEAIGSGKAEDREFAEHFCETGVMDFSKKG